MRLVVVGAGIVGLMIAREARDNDSGWSSVVVIDAGPDPRVACDGAAATGATYSGMDARHISLTETAPWTSASRADLIAQPAAEGGWGCLPTRSLTSDERSWLAEFQSIAASRPNDHRNNTDKVVGLNRAGIAAWQQLSGFPVVGGDSPQSWRLPIVCRTAGDLRNEYAFERSLDSSVVPFPNTALPEGIELLAGSVQGDFAGSFEVAGAAYLAKSLCMRVISELENTGVRFLWHSPVDIGHPGEGADTLVSVTRDALGECVVVWAAGVSVGAASFLRNSGIWLHGVVGCWRRIPNPGFRRAFKVLGAEPVNFINCTPQEDTLILSGGYGYVGARRLSEARKLAQPVMDAFTTEVAWWFFKGDRASVERCPTATCVRPSLPGGVPLIRVVHLRDIPLVLCVGHAAGGFTQAPAVARLALNLATTLRS